MKFGVLVFPGGHGDLDLKRVMRQHFDVDAGEIWYKDPFPSTLEVLMIPGGFPCNSATEGYECLPENGAINRLKRFAGAGGRVLGFGNGFRLLCESGLLPGRMDANRSGTFIGRQIFIKPENVHIGLTSQLDPSRAYRIPMATYSGRFIASEEELIALRQEDQIIFRYCDMAGRITESVNDTGSADNIAGICNRAKNVVGMIPQPERAINAHGANGAGKQILASLLSGKL